MPEGTAGFVLPLKYNIVYIEINAGDHFGEIDLILASGEKNQSIDFMMEHMFQERFNLQRQFTVQAVEDCKLLSLSMQNLQRMWKQFNSHFNKLFEGADQCLENALRLKVLAIKENDRCNLTS